MTRLAVALLIFAVLLPVGRAQTFIRSLPTSTNLTSATKVPVDDATYGTRAVTLNNLLASTATNATLLAAITNVVEDTATALLGNKLDATNGAAYGLSLFGDTIIDTGDELQDTVDYSLALTPNGNTPTENDASARPRSVATIASLVGDVNPLLVPTYARISVLGYRTAGDGGGGDFRRVLASSGTTNAGTFFASTANALYAWERVLPDRKLTSAQWGIVSGSEDLPLLQSWIDYTAANKLEAHLDDGSYVLTNSLVLPSNLQLVGTYDSVFERAAVSSQTNSHNFSALRTAYTFNPYQTNGGYTGRTVPGLVTNVVLRGFRLKTADNYHSSFGIAAFCVDNWQLDSLTVEVMTNHWAITYFGNNIRTRNCLINNGGGIYQDGLHVLGGDSLIFAGNIVSSGDDSFALSPGGMQQQDISNVSIVGNVANSTHAHGIRMFIENESGTNYVRNIVVDGLTGYVAQDRNALVRLESASTNVTYGITNVSLSNIRLIGGDMAAHGGGIAGSDYGYVIHNADNVVITDNHVGPTTLWNYYLLNCGTITLTDCTGEGAQYSSLNATMYVENVENLTINGGRYRNGSALTTDTIWIKEAGNVKMNGVFAENSITNRAAVTLFGTAASSFSAVGCTFTNSGGYSITSYTNPDKVLLVGNILNSIQGISWSGGSPPSGSVVINNVGVTESTVRTGTEYTIQSSGGSYLGGMGSRSSIVRIASTNGTFAFATDDSTGGTKSTRVGGQSSGNGTPVAAWTTIDTGTSAALTLGGVTALMKSPKTVDIATDASYGSGTSRMRVSTGGVVVEPAGVSANANASAALEVRSTTLGLLLPGTTATPSSAADGLIWYRTDTDTFAGQANGAEVNLVTSATIRSGTGSPESVVTAPVGTLYLRTDGGAGSTLYVKESGTGNTGWTALPIVSGGSIGGSTGSTDNSLIRADGTGGSTLQSSAVIIDDYTSSTANNVAIRIDDGSTANISAVVTPKGNGAFILGPKPDGFTTGGNARGQGAVDLSLSRAANYMVAAGNNSFVAGKNAWASAADSAAIGDYSSATATAAYAFGRGSQASGNYSAVIGGYNSTASGQQSAFLAGQGSATATYAVGAGEATANKRGQFATSSGSFSTSGDSQSSIITVRNSTSSTSATELFTDGSSGRLTLANNSAWTFEAKVTGITSGAAASYSYILTGFIRRGANAADTTMPAAVTKTVIYESNASADVDVTADTTNGSLKISVTAFDSTATRWSATVIWNQVGY